MALRFSNNGTSTLASGISNVATSISVAAGHGSRFPSLSGGDTFYATLIDASNNIEIVLVTARSGDTMTVARGQEGTSARAYATGDRFELRPTAGGLEAMLQKTGGTMTGALVLAADPDAALKAATKQYVDAQRDTRLATAGGTMTGFITLHADPDAALKAATKQYVDTQRDTRVAKAGDTLTGTIGSTIQALTDDVTISWNATSHIAKVTLAGNRTMANPTNLKDGNYVLHVIQDATGGRTLTWGSNFKWPLGVAPTLSTAAGARDVFSFTVDGGVLYGSMLKGMA